MVSKHFSFGELFVLDERDSSFWLNECKPQVIFTSMEGSTLQQRSSFESKNLLDSTPPPPRVSAKHLSFHFISLHFISLHFISLHFISLHFISFHFISFHFISFHFISLHFISLHFISFHFTSFHFISLRLSLRVCVFKGRIGSTKGLKTDCLLLFWFPHEFKVCMRIAICQTT